MSVIDLSGTTTGSFTVSTPNPIRGRILTESFGGSGDLSGSLDRTLIFGGQAYGFGLFEDHLTVLLSGTASGQGNALGSLYRVFPLSGFTYGTSKLLESVLEPVYGFGILAGFMQVDRVPCPIACVTNPVPLVFRWGQIFGPGDLMLSIRDTSGNPFAPVVVLYRMFQILKGGSLHPVGPFNRRPVACQKRLGVYYVTGTAGELGQPGDWVLEWRWQRSPYTQPVIERRPFRVLDAVLDTSISDKTCRVKKYGWGD